MLCFFHYRFIRFSSLLNKNGRSWLIGGMWEPVQPSTLNLMDFVTFDSLQLLGWSNSNPSFTQFLIYVGGELTPKGTLIAQPLPPYIED